MKSKMIIYKRSTKNGGWMITDETYEKHQKQNYKIRRERKPISAKLDLDKIMEDALNKK